jgi:acyl-CoA thioesterase
MKPVEEEGMVVESKEIIAKKVKGYIPGRDRLMYLLGAEVLEVSPGYAKVAITVEDKHLNAAEVCHGGVLFSLSDLAFALASNSHGYLALALEVSMSFLRVARLGERVAAKAREEYLGRRTGFYIITVTNQEGKKIALVKGASFRFESPSPPGERIR